MPEPNQISFLKDGRVTIIFFVLSVNPFSLKSEYFRIFGNSRFSFLVDTMRVAQAALETKRNALQQLGSDVTAKMIILTEKRYYFQSTECGYVVEVVVNEF